MECGLGRALALIEMLCGWLPPGRYTQRAAGTQQLARAAASTHAEGSAKRRMGHVRFWLHDESKQGQGLWRSTDR